MHEFLDKDFSIERLRLRYDPRDDRQTCHFPGFHPGIFLVDQQATAALLDLFQTTCRRYLVRCNADLLNIFVCDLILDGFDLLNSRYDALPSSGAISRLTRVAFKRGFYTERPIFRVAGPKEVLYQVFVNDEFRTRYEANGLTGLSFRPTFVVGR
jgi:hypothetical protein